jgi:hypothetical protein
MTLADKGQFADDVYPDTAYSEKDVKEAIKELKEYVLGHRKRAGYCTSSCILDIAQKIDKIFGRELCE